MEYEASKTERSTRDPEQLAEAHWAYVEQVIRLETPEGDFSEDYINAVGFHYKSAFVHGYKHGREEK
jgi:hypothetical protein